MVGGLEHRQVNKQTKPKCSHRCSIFFHDMKREVVFIFIKKNCIENCYMYGCLKAKSNPQNILSVLNIWQTLYVASGLLVGYLTSQQQASASQGRICSDNCTCCHSEIEVADPTFYLTQSQYTDSGPTNPSADPITPGVKCQFLSHWYDSTRKKSRRKRDSNPGPSALGADALTTRPTRRLSPVVHCTLLYKMRKDGYA